MNIVEIVSNLKATKRRFKIKKAPKQIYPLSIEKGYEKFLLTYVKDIHKLYKKNLYINIDRFVSEYTMDSYADETKSITEQVENTINTQYNEAQLRNSLYALASTISRFNKKQVNKVLKKMVGIDLFSPDADLRRAIEPFVVDNVELIRSINTEYKKRVQQAVSEAGRNGYSNKELTTLLNKQFNVTKNRARLIARDQIGKFNGQLTRIRHTNVGITEYIWHTSLDERVRGNPSGLYPNARPSHFQREGKTFDYKKPPRDGNPGEPIRCRCWAEPILNN